MVEPTPIRPGVDLSNLRTDLPLKSGGGGGTSGGDMDNLEVRVKRLEDDGKETRSDMKTIMKDLAEIKVSMATARELGEVKVAIAKAETRIDRLPTMAKMAALAGIAVAVTTILLRWNDLMAYFGGSVPPTP
jgi:hypothetical protein